MKKDVELINPDLEKMMSARVRRDRFQLDFECWVIDELHILSIENSETRVSVSLVRVKCDGHEINWIQS